MPNIVDERETSLVIDHAIAVFHVSSNRKSIANRLRKLAQEHTLTMEESGDWVTLTNVPVTLLTKLHLATLSKSVAQRAKVV